MQRRQNIINILCIILLGRISQVIFSILYDPTLSYQAGIPGGSRTHIMTSHGYRQLKKDTLKEEKPSPIHPTTLTTYNKECSYGGGKCKAYIVQYFYSALQRLDTIQYIGKYINPANPNTIANRLNTITEASPLRSYPYVFTEMMGPSYKKDHQDTTGAKNTRENSIQIGEKGIDYTCDSQKLKKIKNLTYKEFLDAIAVKNPELRAPCQDYRLPHNLAFNYFQYIGDNNKAAYYYMVASFHDDVPGITLSMPAIIRGRAGDNLISATIRYDRFQNAVRQYNNIKDKNNDEAKSIQQTIKNTIKKSVSEISLYILSKTYPHGTQHIKPVEVADTLKIIAHTCDTEQNMCNIIVYGLQQGWIKNNGVLIYPLEDTMRYTWDNKKNIRRLSKS